MPRPLRVALLAVSVTTIIIGGMLLALDVFDERISWISVAGFAFIPG
jgi:hypothetical protein